MRVAAIAYLGGVCSRCGFDDHRALQIDHVRGGGTAERRAQGTRNSRGIYRRILADAASGDYALLCANCNWIKRAELGEVVGGRVYERAIPVTETITAT